MTEDLAEVMIVGVGYVGLATAAAFVSKGYRVIGVDSDEEKIGKLRGGKATIFEPMVGPLLKKAIKSKRISFTTSKLDALRTARTVFITVGTPSLSDGSIDLTYVKECVRDLGGALRQVDGYRLFVLKSTVIPGTTTDVVAPTLLQYSARDMGSIGICYNPEFLREGTALKDTLNPDRVIIGGVDEQSGDALEQLWTSFYGNKKVEIIRTSPANAELIKYANNAFLAMKVSFINSMANLCETVVGGDIDHVARGIGLDRRIGPEFLEAGPGWGGSCFPKDLRALLSFAKSRGIPLPLVEATIKVNDLQPVRVVQRAKSMLGELKNKKIAVLGGAFKQGTDDIREGIPIVIINLLLDEGADVAVHDPAALTNLKNLFGNRITYARTVKQCLLGADCCLLITPWHEFSRLNGGHFTSTMNRPIVIDTRRLLDPKRLGKKVLYVPLGRHHEPKS